LTDWVFELKHSLKRNQRLATAVFYLTDLLYLNNRERRRFLEAFPAGARLLNLGAGFRQSPPGFLGVDREAYAGIDVLADLGALPFPDDSIDGVLCEMVLEHVPDADGALREFRRVLKPGGRISLAVTTPVHMTTGAGPSRGSRRTSRASPRSTSAWPEARPRPS
jgi:SAM-dependent methyltransferase